MTHINAHGADLSEFERQQFEKMRRDHAATIGDRISQTTRIQRFICDGLADCCNLGVHGVTPYEFTPAQLLAVTDLYARALFSDHPPAEDPLQWVLARVGVDWTNQCLTLNWAGMVIAIERDGYCHT